MMRFKASKDKLLPAVQAASRVMLTKTTIPALQGILIEADERLTLKATNLELSVIIAAEAEIEEPGRVLVPGKTLEQILRRTGDVEVKEKDEKLIITSGNAKFELSTMSPEEFPEATIEGEEVGKIKDYELRDAIRQVVFAASDETIRPILNSVLFEFSPGMLRLVATDGHRLAVKEMAVDADKTGEYIVPLKTVERLGRLIKDSVTVSVGNNQIVFETGNVKLISRLVAGQYVSYKSVIPSTFQANVTVNRDDFLATLDRAGIFKDKLGPKVTLQVAPDRLEVYAESYDVGRMEDSLPANADGEMQITFNARYLAEPLRAMVGDKVTLHLTGPQSAAVIQEEGYTYLVMPITRR